MGGTGAGHGRDSSGTGPNKRKFIVMVQSRSVPDQSEDWARSGAGQVRGWSGTSPRSANSIQFALLNASAGQVPYHSRSSPGPILDWDGSRLGRDRTGIGHEKRKLNLIALSRPSHAPVPGQGQSQGSIRNEHELNLISRGLKTTPGLVRVQSRCGPVRGLVRDWSGIGPRLRQRNKLNL